MTNTILLLNAAYQPLTWVPRRRALSLLQRGQVDSATDEAVPIHGVSTIFHIPKVLRLRRYVQTPQLQLQWSRKAVLKRDNLRCIYCGFRKGENGLTRHDMTIDHILPKSRGGKNTWANTACACAPCNQRKADRLPHEAGMKLLWEPKTPRADYLVVDGEMPQAWKVYLAVGDTVE